MKHHIKTAVSLLLGVLFAIVLGIGAYYYQLCKTQSTVIATYKQDNAILVELSEALIEYTASVNEEIQLRQDLTSLIIDASRAYNIDPKLFAINIKSESNFRPNPQHTLPHVKGSAGINIKANNKLKHNANSYVGNIYASAEILARYIETSDSLTLALTRYKGLSPLGFSQAKQVVEEYNKSNQ